MYVSVELEFIFVLVISRPSNESPITPNCGKSILMCSEIFSQSACPCPCKCEFLLIIKNRRKKHEMLDIECRCPGMGKADSNWVSIFL